MTRSLWSRVLVGVWGIWLTTSMSGMAGAHMSHGADGHAAGHSHVMEMGSAAMEMGSAPPAAPVPTAEHASHHDAQATDATGRVASRDDSHHAQSGFACLEQCCCGTPIAIAARAVTLSANPRTNALLQRYAEAVTLRARRAHSQPFANGPPTAV